MTAPGFALADVALRLGGFALHDVSLAAGPGEVLVLLGPNGAGKSVCLETIAGFHRPAAGRVLIGGRDVTAFPPERRRLAFLVQDFALFPHLSIAENVAIGSDRSCGAAERRTLLSRFGIAHLAEARPQHLSPGEKQRAALARALASRPQLYLFDEPFAALDAGTAECLREELGAFMRQSGVPSLFVTHDRAEALALADRVAVIDGGRICQQGTAAEVFARPNGIAVARLLGVENILDGHVVAVTTDILHIGIGCRTLTVAKTGTLAAARQVSLCIRAEHVHLLPSSAEPRPNCFPARVVDVRCVGPLWKVRLDCGFPLLAYALPQITQAVALAPGNLVDAAIDAAEIHLIEAP